MISIDSASLNKIVRKFDVATGVADAFVDTFDAVVFDIRDNS